MDHHFNVVHHDRGPRIANSTSNSGNGSCYSGLGSNNIRQMPISSQSASDFLASPRTLEEPEDDNDRCRTASSLVMPDSPSSKSLNGGGGGGGGGVVGTRDIYELSRIKGNKRDPLVHRVTEKQRRDKMNSSLADLSQLIPMSFLNRKSGGRIEKIDIVLMAIEYIDELVKSSEATYTHGFFSGIGEAIRYLQEHNNVSATSDQDGPSSVKNEIQQLKQHLNFLIVSSCPSAAAHGGKSQNAKLATCSRFLSPTDTHGDHRHGHQLQFSRQSPGNVNISSEHDFLLKSESDSLSGCARKRHNRQVDEDDEEDDGGAESYFTWKKVCRDGSCSGASLQPFMPRKASSSEQLQDNSGATINRDCSIANAATTSPTAFARGPGAAAQNHFKYNKADEEGAAYPLTSLENSASCYKKQMKERFMSSQSPTNSEEFEDAAELRELRGNDHSGGLESDGAKSKLCSNYIGDGKSAAFVLHPDGKFYMPTFLDSSLADNIALRAIRESSFNGGRGSPSQILHPVNICVAFSTDQSADGGHRVAGDSCDRSLDKGPINSLR